MTLTSLPRPSPDWEVSETQAQLVTRFRGDGVEGSWGGGDHSQGLDEDEEEGGSPRHPHSVEPFLHVRQDVFPSDASAAPSLTSAVCRFSIDGDYMASGGSDGFLYVWSPHMTQPVGMDCHSEAPRILSCLCFPPLATPVAPA